MKALIVSGVRRGVAAAAVAVALLPGGSSAQRAAIETLLSLPRTEARHEVEAALALMDLGEVDRAKAIADEFAGRELDPQQSIALVEAVGPAALARLARELPATAARVEDCLAKAEAASMAPDRVAALLARVAGENAEDRLAAIDALRRSGEGVVAATFRAIAEANSPPAEARLREALVALAPLSITACLAGLDDANPAVRTQSAYALGRMADLGLLRSPLAGAMLAGAAVSADDAPSHAAQWAYGRVIGGAPDPVAVAEMLRQGIEELLADAALPSTDADGLVPWPAAAGGEALRLPRRDAGVALASRLATRQAALAGGDPRVGRLAAALSIEAAAILGTPPPGGVPAVADLPTEGVSACLAESLLRELPVASMACCEELGRRRDTQALFGAGASPTPLAAALASPLEGVRFAALEAIVAIGSPTPFAGSSRVAVALRYFAAGGGPDRLVAAAPQAEAATQLAALVGAGGVPADPVTRGREAIGLAAESPDRTAIILDTMILDPAVRETLFRLRRTVETGGKPVALVAREGRLGDAEELAAEHGGESAGVFATPRPHSAEAAAQITQRLAALRPRGAADPAERARRAQWAASTAERLAAEGPRYYGLAPAGRPR